MTAETPRPRPRPRALPRLRVPRFLRWWEHEDEEVAEERVLLVRILIAIVWLPIQITLSLLFATGGLFLLLILGIALAPLIGIGYLLWSLVRRGPAGPADPAHQSLEAAEGVDVVQSDPTAS